MAFYFIHIMNVEFLRGALIIWKIYHETNLSASLEHNRSYYSNNNFLHIQPTNTSNSMAFLVQGRSQVYTSSNLRNRTLSINLHIHHSSSTNSTHQTHFPTY